MMTHSLKVGQNFSGMYPVHGTMNILRKIEGVVDHIGKGPGGKFVCVAVNDGTYRSLSIRKIVQL